jgi:outer membrane protein assembly factor BamB
VIFATSSGRIAALDLASGQLAWQTRAGEGALDQLVANDDFIAARFIDEGGPQLVALETFGGQIVMRTSFTPETAPLNIRLAPDGTLLYTRPDRICGKDLYEPGAALKFGDNPIADGQRIFDGSGGVADQLVVAEGRIYAAADAGQFIRVLSLYDGKEVGNRLSTGSTDFNNVRMRVVGPRLYVFNSRTVTSYHVVRDDESWTGLIDSFQAPAIRDEFVGKQHVVLLDQPTPPGAQPAGDASPRFRLLAYGRYPTADGRDDESGKFDQSVDVTHPVGIHVAQWQPVEGGFYYHSVDRKVHFLKGAGTDEAR